MQEVLQYACRKTLADSRPRVRGRFAKNDDFGEVTRPSGSNHEDDEDEEVTSFRILFQLSNYKNVIVIRPQYPFLID